MLGGQESPRAIITTNTDDTPCDREQKHRVSASQPASQPLLGSTQKIVALQEGVHLFPPPLVGFATCCISAAQLQSVLYPPFLK